MTMHNVGRPTAPVDLNAAAATSTFTGNQGLAIEEPLLFEVGRLDISGVDLDEVDTFESRLGGLARTASVDLPGLTEPEAMRHYVRLSRQNYAIDLGLYPLGSCTMKHNPRLNEAMARLAGFGDVHPLQPLSTVAGAVELVAELGRWLLELTGMASVAMSPKAGAHGEMCGMAAIKAAIVDRGEAPRRGAGARIGAWHQSGDGCPARFPRGRRPCARRRYRRSGGGQEAPRPRGGSDHADQPQHLRSVRARHHGDCRGGARGRRLFLR